MHIAIGHAWTLTGQNVPHISRAFIARLQRLGTTAASSVGSSAIECGTLRTPQHAKPTDGLRDEAMTPREQSIHSCDLGVVSWSRVCMNCTHDFN